MSGKPIHIPDIENYIQDLEPCPFCKGNAIFGRREGDHKFRVVCSECLASSDWYDTLQDAEGAWNVRAEWTCGLEPNIEGDWS